MFLSYTKTPQSLTFPVLGQYFKQKVAPIAAILSFKLSNNSEQSSHCSNV